jgi:4-hydroxybenzoate polyprenyltransferase
VSRSLAQRFLEYQAERFPLASYVPLIATFTFSSIAYSRLSRGAPGFVPWPHFLIGTLTALVFFFLLRVLDEHKDQDVDRRYRPELPVPRGLVTLRELRWIGSIAMIVVLLLNLWISPRLLWAFLAFAGWAALMTREFFVRDWLRAHPAAYLISHMFIMPMIDAYTTGLDWLVACVPAPHGLVFFLAVTFLNGTLIEIGRKIRPLADEREGVDTYTQAWGLRRAPIVWLLVLAITVLTAWLAARATGAGAFTALALIALGIAAAFPALQFLRNANATWSKRLETASGLWPIATYLLLGGGPFVARWLAR